MSLSAAVGAPSQIRVGDNTYNASPLNLYELGALEELLRASILNAAARAAIGLPPDIRQELLDRALTKAMDVAFNSPEMAKFSRTFKGTCAMIALSVRPLHPEVNEQDIGRELAKRMDQYEPAISTITRISGFTSKPDGGDDKPGEAQAGA